MRPRLEQAPHGCCRSHLSLAKLSVHDFVMAIYRARTFGVCKGRRKAGLCLCVDLAAEADVEQCRPWCDWIEALAELNLVEKEDVWRRKPRGNRESNDSSTIRPPASTLRVDRPCAARDACSARSPSSLLLSKSPVWLRIYGPFCELSSWRNWPLPKEL